MGIESVYVGTRFRVTSVFSVVATSAITDTTPVDVSIRHPSSTSTTYQYPTSTEVVKGTTGTFYVDIDPDAAGEWVIGFGSTGTVYAYSEVAVRVLPRRS